MIRLWSWIKMLTSFKKILLLNFQQSVEHRQRFNYWHTDGRKWIRDRGTSCQSVQVKLFRRSAVKLGYIFRHNFIVRDYSALLEIWDTNLEYTIHFSNSNRSFYQCASNKKNREINFRTGFCTVNYLLHRILLNTFGYKTHTGRKKFRHLSRFD